MFVVAVLHGGLVGVLQLFVVQQYAQQAAACGGSVSSVVACAVDGEWFVSLQCDLEVRVEWKKQVRCEFAAVDCHVQDDGVVAIVECVALGVAAEDLEAVVDLGVGFVVWCCVDWSEGQLYGGRWMLDVGWYVEGLGDGCGADGSWCWWCANGTG